MKLKRRHWQKHPRATAHAGQVSGASREPSDEMTRVEAEPSREIVKLLADLGTGLWRLRASLSRAAGEDARGELRIAHRHFESLLDVLRQGGVEICDHTSEEVPRGGIYALKAVAYEHTPGLERDRVVETIKPTVYFKDRIIQIGEVIIGTPDSTAEEEGGLTHALG